MDATDDVAELISIDGFVATLTELYGVLPVSSARIGKGPNGMRHHQVLLYLHMAKKAGRATPVFSNPG